MAKALASGNCRLYADREAVFVEPGADDWVTAVHCVDGAGAWHSYAGRAFVLACGAVHTPRLLLASANGHAPDRLDFMAGKSRAILQAIGVERIVEEQGTYYRFASTHVFGTCRMGRDPQKSVVDPYCCSHRWRNLHRRCQRFPELRRRRGSVADDRRPGFALRRHRCRPTWRVIRAAAMAFRSCRSS